jgi:hypothetical protein
MKVKNLVWLFSFAAILIIGSFVACNKEVDADASIPAGQSKVQILMTDDPSLIFDSIFIDIRRVEVKVERANNGGEYWDTLNIRPGIYNILNFRNGIDTLLASGFIANGEIKKLRMTLGTNNSVMKSGVRFPLRLHNNDPYVIIDIPDVDRIASNSFRIWIDFDGHGSIIKVRNNEFELKSKIKAFNNMRTGSVEGKIKPSAALPAIVAAIVGNDTLVAIPERDGKFKIRGITASTIKLLIIPSNGYRDSLMTNISIPANRKLDLDDIVLRR